MASLPLKMLEPLRKLRGDRWPRDDRIAYQFSDGKSRLSLNLRVPAVHPNAIGRARAPLQTLAAWAAEFDRTRKRCFPQRSDFD